MIKFKLCEELKMENQMASEVALMHEVSIWNVDDLVVSVLADLM